MKKKPLALITVICVVCLMFLPLSTGARAYTPKYNTLMVGLYTSDAGNLENEVGEGYRFGYLDSDRNFVDLGIGYDGTNISVIRDSNMYYSSGQYYIGTGDTTVYCHHMKLQTPFSSYALAYDASLAYENSFIRYENGSFYVLFGGYLSSIEAGEALTESAYENVAVDSGTVYTLTVVETGTSKILFEFDDAYGNGRRLCVMPVSAEKAQTWTKGYTYYGAFQYCRPTGGDIYVINAVNIEDYVKGVIPYEMSNSWPLEALKTQACCARTYAMYCINCEKHGYYDICNTTDCQVYRGTNLANDTTDRAVEETSGQYITYNGTLCQTYYSSSDGGASESSKNVWGGEFDYLTGVMDPYEEVIADSISNYYWTVNYTASEMSDRLAYLGYISYGTTVTNVEISKFSDTGNAIGARVSYLNSDGEVKSITFSGGSKVCSVFDTYSIRFTIEKTGGTAGNGKVFLNDSDSASVLPGLYATGGDGIQQVIGGSVYALSGEGTLSEVGGTSTSSDGSYPTNYRLVGTGWGHNVGMSQWGAYAMAKYYGKTYDEIIKFYYTGVTVG